MNIKRNKNKEKSPFILCISNGCQRNWTNLSIKNTFIGKTHDKVFFLEPVHYKGLLLNKKNKYLRFESEYIHLKTYAG